MDIYSRVSVARCTVSAAVTSALLFVLCWVGAYLEVAQASHLFIGLFTVAAPMSSLALVTGLCSALIFGALVGAIFAVVFNIMGRWFQR